MNLNEISKLNYAAINSIWNETRAELMYEAFCKTRDLSEWAQYLKDHPPSPEVLAFLIGLGLEKFQSQKGRMAGHASGIARRKKVLCTPEAVAKLYQQEMATGTEKRNIAARLAKRLNVTPDHIRNLHRQAKNKRD